jgi:ABC-2 type transport system ATP-binding protein
MLKTTHLTKKYGDFTALNNVSITVEKGDVYGLIGKNGAGKTTLFKLVMGLSEKNSGDILIDNQTDLNVGRSQIGFMIGLSFFPYLNAHQNMEYHRKMKGANDKKETERVLRLVGLYGEKKPFKSFSMGMKQRLGIANALLGNPPFVILDEPVNGLDPQGIIDIRNMIKNINAEYGTTFIISSHILSELDLVATKFGFIHEGVLLKEIAREELHQHTGKSLVVETDDIEKATKALTDAGLKHYTVKKQKTTLEDYFFNLIGGSKS